MKTIEKNIILGQIEVIAWQPEKNLKKIVETIEQTKAWTLIIFPEMAIPGYMIWDKWLQDSFIKELKDMNQDIIKATKKAENSAIWWNIDYNDFKTNQDWSKRKYNTAYIASKWEMVWKRYKTLLPNYWKFDDKRYFTSLERLVNEREENIKNAYEPFEIEIAWVKQKVGILICEDIWNINWTYPINPIELTKKYNPDIIAVPSASPFEIDKTKFRQEVLKTQSKNTTLAYVNPIWVQNSWKNIYIFDWESAIYKDSKKIIKTKDYKEFEIENNEIEKNEIEKIYEALIYAIKTEFKNRWFKKVVIGLSGWIDSAIVATLLTKAIWKENIIAVNMPSKFNSNTTKNLAEELANNLGIEYKIYPIQEEVDLKVKNIEKINWEKPSNFEIENIQARTRGQVLADLAPRYNAIFTSNWNKDELSTGYATLYWDTSGAISIIWDLHKSQVFELCRYINSKYDKEIIPVEMIDMKPSAELSDDQNIDNAGWDPFNYEFLGKLKKAFIERSLTPVDILIKFQNWNLEKKLKLDKPILEYFETKEKFIEEIEKLWKLKHNNFFKRIQYPPIITLTSSAFWTDYRESQNWVYFGREYEKIKKEILAN